MQLFGYVPVEMVMITFRENAIDEVETKNVPDLIQREGARG